MLYTYIQSIRKNMAIGLPGKSAHGKMSVHDNRLKIEPPTSSKKAGVMILLYPRNDQIYIAYILRKVFEKDVHKGQISFPGGKMEDHDESIVETSIRETREEIGIHVPTSNIIGSLTPLYIPVSNFLVHPVIAYLDQEPHFVIQEEELDDIIETSLDYIVNPEIKSIKTITIASGINIPQVPYYDLKGHTLWGATAMITAEFLELL